MTRFTPPKVIDPLSGYGNISEIMDFSNGFPQKPQIPRPRPPRSFGVPGNDAMPYVPPTTNPGIYAPADPSYNPVQNTQVAPLSNTPVAALQNQTETVNPAYDPLQIAPVAPSQSLVQPSQTEDRFQLYDPSMVGDYNRQIGSMLSGETYDPYRYANMESLNRQEEQQRANTAGQINRFGGLGQGIGDQVANATESGIARNRFDQTLKMDVAENDMKQKGLQELRNTIGAEGQLTNIDAAKLGMDVTKLGMDETKLGMEKTKQEMEQDRFNFGAQKTAEAGKNVAAYVQTHTNLRGMTGEQMLQDQGFKNNMQSYWEAQGGTGSVPPAWAKMQVDAINDPKLNNSIVASNDEIDQAIAAGVYTPEQGQLLKDFSSQGMLQFLTRDPETGNAVFDFKKLKEYLGEEDDGEEEGDDDPTDLSDETLDALEYTPSQMTEKQVKNVFEAYKANPNSKGLENLISNGDDVNVLNSNILTWTTKGGKRRWKLSGEAKEWANTNKGKFFTIGGKLYQLTGMVDADPDKPQSVGYYTFRDETGNVVKINNAKGNMSSGSVYTWPE